MTIVDVDDTLHRSLWSSRNDTPLPGDMIFLRMNTSDAVRPCSFHTVLILAQTDKGTHFAWFDDTPSWSMGKFVLSAPPGHASRRPRTFGEIFDRIGWSLKQSIVIRTQP